MLEVLDVGASTATHETPLLFVHGTSHAAWCWDEHFLSYFAEHGYRAIALNLRGHGRSPLDRSLRGVTLSDFADDLRTAVYALESPPVLIGHSLGGSSSRSIWNATTRAARSSSLPHRHMVRGGHCRERCVTTRT